MAYSGEILFYPLETKKTTLFAKSLIGKCQISKSRGAKALYPRSDSHGDHMGLAVLHSVFSASQVFCARQEDEKFCTHGKGVQIYT